MCYKAAGKNKSLYPESFTVIWTKQDVENSSKTPKNNSCECRIMLIKVFSLSLLWEKRGCRSYSAWNVDLPSWSVRTEKATVGMGGKKKMSCCIFISRKKYWYEIDKSCLVYFHGDRNPYKVCVCFFVGPVPPPPPLYVVLLLTNLFPLHPPLSNVSEM